MLWVIVLFWVGRQQFEAEALKVVNHLKGEIVKRHSLMRYDVLIPGRPYPYEEVLTLKPVYFEKGEIVDLGFLEGRPELPFILTEKPWYSVYRPPRLLLGLPAYWYCEQANFMRTQSLSAEVSQVPIENLSAAPIDPVIFDRWLEDYRVRVEFSRIEIPRDPGTKDNRALWWFSGVNAEEEVAAAVGLDDGSFGEWWEEEYGPIDPEYQSKEHSLLFAQRESACIVGDLVYLELLITIETEVTEQYGPNPEDSYSYSQQDQRRVLFALTADPPTFWIEVVWSVVIDAISDAFIDSRTDIVVHGGKVCILFETPELYLLEADTGNNLTQVDLDSVGTENSVATLSECIGNRWLQTFAKDGKLFFGRSADLTCVDLESAEVVWTRSTEAVDNEITVYHPLGFAADGNLTVAYERRTYETITDYPLSIEWDPVPEPEDRVELASGLSHVAGIAVIDVETGEEVGSSQWGEIEPNGQQKQSVVDYVKSVYFENWTSLGNPIRESDGELDPNNYGIVLARSPKFPRYHNYFIGGLSAPYQQTNVTGTYIEGQSGSFEGVFAELSYKKYDPVTGDPGVTGCGLAPDLYIHHETKSDEYVNKLNGRVDPQLPGVQFGAMQDAMAGVEKSQNDAADKVRADILRITTQTAGLFNPPANTWTQFGEVLELIDITLSNEENFGTPVETPRIEYTRGSSNFIPIPSSTPSFGSPVNENWSENFKDWHINRTEDSVNPWEGRGIGSCLNTPDPDTLGSVDFQQKLIWRPGPTYLPRTKTSAPPVTLGPAVQTGRYLVLGPRSANDIDQMVWEAYDSQGQLAWRTTIEKNAFPGSPIGVYLDEGTIGVWTCYTYQSKFFVCVLDGDTGAVLYDEEQPENIDILEIICGDGAIWDNNGFEGISGGGI